MLENVSEGPRVHTSHQQQAIDSAYSILNDTGAPYPIRPLHELVRLQAKRTPHNIAITFKETEITYEHLQRQANQLAYCLAQKGIEPGDLIGVCLPRCADLPAVFLAILQCGAAFVPLDPNYPKKRLEFMLSDAEAKYLITTKDISTAFRVDQDLLLLERILEAAQKHPMTTLKKRICVDAMAYQIYTSGSTGKPKGIRATHKNLVNFLWSMLDAPGIQEGDRLLSITTISFDPFLLELFLPLIKGATIVMADAESARDGRILIDLLQSRNISILQATPTTWQMLLDAGWNKPLPLKALCGGEALSRALALKLNELCAELWNMYGPTETTVWSIIKRISSDDDVIAVGRPIANTAVFLLDKSQALVPPGQVGEIAIGGDGVTLGYHNRPALMAEKFIRNPLINEPQRVLYQTGDLGKLLPNGEIQCLGRIDQQVKIRGHRIEPGEIEQALIALEDMRAAAVLAHDDRLIAYVELSKSAMLSKHKLGHWRDALSIQLPAPWIPHEFISIDKLPKTPNGKIDRKSLIGLELTRARQKSYTAPRTSYEKLVSAIWQEYLELDRVDIFSNFFELGGHSITAVRVMTTVELKTGKRLPLSTLFEHPTIEEFARRLQDDLRPRANEYLVPIRPKGTKSPLYMVHGAGLNVLIFNDLAQGLHRDQPVFGIQGSDLMSDDVKSITVEALASNYVEAILKADHKGPYSLAGYSFGGFIAFEMARLLRERKKEIKALAILDTYVELRQFQRGALLKRWASLRYHTLRLYHLVRDMGQGWSNFVAHINRKRSQFLARKRRSKEWSKEELAELNAYRTMEAKVSEIMNKYQITPLDVKVDLFKASHQTRFMHDPDHRGWKSLARNGVRVHKVPGDHLDMLTSANAHVIARALQTVLDGTEADR